MALAIGSFLFFTALVGFLTWLIVRKDNPDDPVGFFLAGRSLTFPFIAGSLLLTNLSTEQLVGLNGDAYTDGLCVMAWEIIPAVALVFMAWFFLPRFLKSGVTTVPQYLGIRFDHQTQVITNLFFLVAYVVVVLPMILYTGARGMMGAMDVPALLGTLPEQLGAQPDVAGTKLDVFVFTPTSMALWLIVIAVGVIGSIYALFGGLKTVAVSDTINGVGLLVGGFLITFYGLAELGGGDGIAAGAESLFDEQYARFNSVGGLKSTVPFPTLFSGVILLNLFYWTTNQQIIQRALAAKNLAEGQKGVLLTAVLKLLGPLYLVIPGMIALSLFGRIEKSDAAYGMLVNRVLPAPLTGFFAAVMLGAILSSYNSVLNSSCTLFSLGLYKGVFRKHATEREVVQSSKIFGWVVAAASMALAPLLAQTDSIFGYLQKMNGIYFIPIFAVVLVAMLTKRVSAVAAKVGLVAGAAVISIGYFVPPFDRIVAAMHDFHFLGVVFAWLLVLMLVLGEIYPRATEFTQADAKAVDMTPWRGVKPVGVILIALVIAIYATLADFSTLSP